MKRPIISMVLAGTLIVLTGCGGQKQATTSPEPQAQQAQTNQSESTPEPTPAPAEEPKKTTDDNDKIQEMLDGKLNDKTVKISGTVFVNGNDGGITTIQIYPDPDTTKLVVTAYFKSTIASDIKVGDKVILKGLCKGKMEVPGDTSVLGMLADSVEKI